MYKSQYFGGQKEKFVRLDDLDTMSISSDTGKVKKCGFNIEGLAYTDRRKRKSKSVKFGFPRGSDGIMTVGRSIKTGVTRAVFPEDLKVSDKRIFDPQDKSLLFWNRLFVISCIFAIAIDPFFFYLPIFNKEQECLSIDKSLAVTSITVRTLIDVFYLIRMAFQFRTAYIAPSSRVFGRGELVIDSSEIAQRYLHRYFFVDLLSVLPAPQIVVFVYLHGNGAAVLTTKKALLYIVWFQLLPRFARLLALNSDLKKSAGSFAETAWAGAAYYMLWFMLAAQVTGAAWYLLSVERYGSCWWDKCAENGGQCKVEFLYCGSESMPGYDEWSKVKEDVVKKGCSAEGEDTEFDYGIFKGAVESDIISSTNFGEKFLYCLWFGLKSLSTLGQGLETTSYPMENIFSIGVGTFGLILFALLIGNIQTYLQSLTIRLEEMRIKRRDSEQWMHHRWLPQELRERVRRYDQYKWLETRGVDEESIVRTLPKDLRRDIKRHLCLNLVRRVPLFTNMDERLLDAICERLKPSLCTENTFIVREGDPVGEMLFIIRGRLESVTTDGGRTGFYNRGLLQEGDFCGEELLTWALDPKAGSNLPSSTRTVKAITEVEAFALEAEELKFVSTQFRHLHSRQVQYTFRFYSQQWRTWAACFIQAAWRHYRRRVALEKQREEEGFGYSDGDDDNDDDDGGGGGDSKGGSGKHGLGAAILASRFAAKTLRGHRLRSSGRRELLKLQKPPEPDFSAYDDK
ncbi:PREDICTED: putative cyclic nucleotide-gated ion channel 7 [Fragaria vesca subsp. vesca]|uniref:putative cyclic nucleotide-gated ion channel 7 n=1 Tax=Fragaria vesca subsp. vesca TaxID=101020 RepID=UPI0002C2F382|nr:PREDICTED: putative cyclic nucleotide-gated ion channel 7 [Fragaria vesca subsp. vesca]XP_011467022.1 PREDICTED: putative cyclic nucleotide-gated ion channel 7 [Fragaria vesca subsp. vesca]